VRFELFTAANINIRVFWYVMLCSLEETCQYFGRICSPNLSGCLVTIFWHVTPYTLQCKYQFLRITCRRHLKYVSSRFLRKVFAYLPKYKASHFKTHLVFSRFMCSLHVMRNLNASTIIRSGHTERGLPQRTGVSVRCGMLHSKQTLLTIIF